MTDKEIVIAAAEAMGWTVYQSGRGSTIAEDAEQNEQILATTHPWEQVTWNPLTSISDAWMLVEAIRERGLSQAMVAQLDGMADAAGYPAERGSGIEWFIGACQDAPRAITLASLKALGGGKA